MKSLRAVWEETVKEPVPEELTELLEMLPRSESDPERGDGLEGDPTNGS